MGKFAAGLRRYMPKSLLWRTVLIVVAPIVLLQAVVAYLIIERHFDGVTRQMTEVVASELRYLADYADGARTSAEARSEMARASRTLGFPISLIEGAKLPTNRNPLFYDVIGRAVEETLLETLARPTFIAIRRSSKQVDVRIMTRHGLLRATMPRRRVIASNPHLLLTWMAAAAAALATIALLYLRNQIRPIQALAKAADAFGKGRIEPIEIAGASEVRTAATAFVDARARIERHLEQRTRMLSGVSHDLRTPLTRMRLSLEMMDETPERAELRRDVDEMADMIEEFLAYARGDHGEAFERVDLTELAREVVADARRMGRKVTLFEQIETPGETALDIRPRAIRRCLHNLLSNAFRYGDEVRLSLTLSRVAAEFAVEDDGPGIPPERRAAALKPFYRLDEARNRNRGGGGVGLGLALALDTARGHGGDLLLGASKLGGLLATVRLPR